MRPPRAPPAPGPPSPPAAIYVTYGWLPAALRNQGIMAPLVSLGMCMTSLAVEFAGIVAGGAAAPRAPCLAVAAAAAPLVSLVILGTVAALDARSAAGAWVLQNLSMGLCGFVLGLHAACFVFVYALEMRSTGGGRGLARLARGAVVPARLTQHKRLDCRTPPSPRVLARIQRGHRSRRERASDRVRHLSGAPGPRPPRVPPRAGGVAVRPVRAGGGRGAGAAAARAEGQPVRAGRPGGPAAQGAAGALLTRLLKAWNLERAVTHDYPSIQRSAWQARSSGPVLAPGATTGCHMTPGTINLRFRAGTGPSASGLGHGWVTYQSALKAV